MDKSTSRQFALVTGAAYGVGAATAQALARAGFDVAVSARRAENLATTMAKLAAVGARAVPLVLDLNSLASIERAMAEVIATFGRLDLLVNNAGGNLRKLAVDVAPADWDAVMATTLRGAFFLSQPMRLNPIATGRQDDTHNHAPPPALTRAAKR